MGVFAAYMPMMYGAAIGIIANSNAAFGGIIGRQYWGEVFGCERRRQINVIRDPICIVRNGVVTEAKHEAAHTTLGITAETSESHQTAGQCAYRCCRRILTAGSRPFCTCLGRLIRTLEWLLTCLCADCCLISCLCDWL